MKKYLIPTFVAVFLLSVAGLALVAANGAPQQDVDRTNRTDRLRTRTFLAPDGINTCRATDGYSTFCTLVAVTTRMISGKPCTIRYGCRTLRPGPAELLTPAQRCEGAEESCGCRLGITDPDHADEELSDANSCKDGDLE